MLGAASSGAAFSQPRDAPAPPGPGNFSIPEIEEQLLGNLAPTADRPTPSSAWAWAPCHISRPHSDSSVTLPTGSAAHTMPLCPPRLTDPLQETSQPLLQDQPTPPAAPSQDLLASQLGGPRPNSPFLYRGTPPPPSVPGQQTMPLSSPGTEAGALLLSFDRPSNSCPANPTGQTHPLHQ